MLKAPQAITGTNYSQAIRDADAKYAAKIPESVPLVGGASIPKLLGGIVGTAPAGAAKIGSGLLTGAKAAFMPAKAAVASRIGLQGLAGGATAADNDGDLKDIAAATGLGFAGGAVGEGLGFALQKLAPAARQALRDFAQSQAGKAILGGATMANKVKSAGMTQPQFDKLASDVLDSGLLGYGPFPRDAKGINKAVESRLSTAGSELGRVRELADDMVSKGVPGANPAAVTDAYTRGGLLLAQKSGLADHLDNLVPVAKQGEKFTRQALNTPKGGSFESLWNQSSRMANSAYGPGDSIGDALAKRELSRAGIARAREQIASQMEGVVGPDEMANHAAAMKDYATMSRVSGFTEDAAARAAARNTVGLGDTQMAQTLGLTGGTAAAALPLISLVRSRANSGLAMGANALSKGTPMGAGLATVGAKLGAPAVGRAPEYIRKPEDDTESSDAFGRNGF
jgi:hypothetical protein